MAEVVSGSERFAVAVEGTGAGIAIDKVKGVSEFVLLVQDNVVATLEAETETGTGAGVDTAAEAELELVPEVEAGLP